MPNKSLSQNLSAPSPCPLPRSRREGRRIASKSSTTHGIFGWLVVGLVVACGCGPNDRGNERTPANTSIAPSSTPAAKLESKISRRIKGIERIRQHGQIDLEVQQQMEAVLAGYRVSLEEQGQGPADWNALIQAGRSTILIEDARQRGTRLAFGLDPSQWSDPAMQDTILGLMPNADGGGWALEVDGTIRELSGVEFETAVLANE